MKDLKSINSDLQNSLTFETKIVADYPPYLYYSPGLYVSWEKFNVGIHTTLNSTGSRISSKDYSGQYGFDTRVFSFAPSIYVDALIVPLQNKLNLYFSTEIGAIFSSLALDERLVLYDEVLIDESFDFYALNYFIEPGLKLDYQFNDIFSAAFNMSYLVQFGDNAYEANDIGTFYYKQNAIKPEWNSLRIGLALHLTIPRANN